GLNQFSHLRCHLRPSHRPHRCWCGSATCVSPIAIVGEDPLPSSSSPDLRKGPLFITPSALLVLRELVHEQANDLNEDDMDTTEAGIGDENEAFMDDENENYMDFEYIHHQLLAQGQKHVIRTQYVNLKKITQKRTSKNTK
uniref:Uncharacterized protein n=1 Tax=Oryza glaberrima TaxID=4538 RepID=I1QSV7_ORYGL